MDDTDNTTGHAAPPADGDSKQNASAAAPTPDLQDSAQRFPAGMTYGGANSGGTPKPGPGATPTQPAAPAAGNQAQWSQPTGFDQGAQSPPTTRDKGSAGSAGQSFDGSAQRFPAGMSYGDPATNHQPPPTISGVPNNALPPAYLPQAQFDPYGNTGYGAVQPQQGGYFPTPPTQPLPPNQVPAASFPPAPPGSPGVPAGPPVFDTKPFHALWAMAALSLLLAAVSAPTIFWLFLAAACGVGGWLTWTRRTPWPNEIAGILMQLRLAQPHPPGWLPSTGQQPPAYPGFTAPQAPNQPVNPPPPLPTAVTPMNLPAGQQGAYPPAAFPRPASLGGTGGGMAAVAAVLSFVGAIWHGIEAIQAFQVLDAVFKAFDVVQRLGLHTNQGWMVLIVGMAIAQILVPILLLIGGIQLLRRSYSGIHLVTFGCLLELALLGVATFLVFQLAKHFGSLFGGYGYGSDSHIYGELVAAGFKSLILPAILAIVTWILVRTPSTKRWCSPPPPFYGPANYGYPAWP